MIQTGGLLHRLLERLRIASECGIHPRALKRLLQRLTILRGFSELLGEILEVGCQLLTLLVGKGWVIDLRLDLLEFLHRFGEIRGLQSIDQRPGLTIG